MKSASLRITLCAVLLLAAGAAQAQSAPAAAADAPPAGAKAPDAIDLYFDSGSSAIRQQDIALLDHASRLYNEGKPIVMIVAGSADRTGSAAFNLQLSQTRADRVVHELVARGIPVERFQVLAKGVSDQSSSDSEAQSSNRRVEITWR